GLPAALSSTFVRDLLRTKLGFNGVVITDALQAGAVTALNKTPAEIAVMAVKAGNDQLLELAEGGPADLDAAYNGVLKAVRSVDTVAQAIHADGPQASSFPTGFAPDQATINQAVANSKGNSVIVVLVYNVWQPQFNSPQENLVAALVNTGKPVVVIAQGTPYD